MEEEKVKSEIVHVYCNETGEDVEIKLQIEDGKVINAELYD